MIADALPLASVTLRAATAEDDVFLRRLYASTREDELAVVDWSEEQKTAFLTMQFDAQSSYYRAHYPDAHFDIIEVEGVAAGRLYVFAGASELRVIDIALLPQYRNRGLGASLMRNILRSASETGRVVTIHVEVNNPARHLYERLGFAPIEERGVYLLMRWARTDSSPVVSEQKRAIA
jgi:ribosomal protein S18 acetylase RimI-like enzyme